MLQEMYKPELYIPPTNVLTERNVNNSEDHGQTAESTETFQEHVHKPDITEVSDDENMRMKNKGARKIPKTIVTLLIIRRVAVAGHIL
jgi:hypothetical protein